MAKEASRANLLETIELQRIGFRGLGSPFYDSLGEKLATSIRADGPTWDILAPFATAPFEDAYVLRLFAGVHRAALDGSAPRVAAHFPSTGGDGDAESAMRAIIELLGESPGTVQSALAVPPQTNEVGRSASLASGLQVIASETHLPIRLREIGSSGGLNLRLDSYWYEQDGSGWGDQDASVRFVDLWEGGAPAFSSPEIIDRRGCDRHPIDAASASGALTLLSYVWPEPRERFIRLRNAIEIAERAPVVIDEEDAAEWLLRELAETVEGTVLVVMHSVVWQYLEKARAESIRAAIAEAGAAATPESPIAWLRLEPNPETYAPAELRLSLWTGREARDLLLATTGFHGGPIRWCR